MLATFKQLLMLVFSIITDLIWLDFTQYPPWDYGGRGASRS